MFLSAGPNLAIHTVTDDAVDTQSVQLPASRAKVISASFCNDNSYILLLRENDKPCIISAKDKNNMRLILVINIENISCATFKKCTKKCIAMGTNKGDLILYDTKIRDVSQAFPVNGHAVTAVDFTCDDHQICGIDGDVLFVLTDVTDGDTLRKFTQTCECTFVKCHPHNTHQVMVGYKDGHMALCDLQNGAQVLSVKLGDTAVSTIAMSSCGNYLLIAGNDVKISGIDSTFKYRLEQERAVTSMALSPDDQYIVVGLSDGTLKVYDVKLQFKQIHCSKHHDLGVTTVAFENMSKLPTSTFASTMKLVEDRKPQESNVHVGPSVNFLGRKSVEERVGDLENLKKSLTRMVKHEMDCLESQLQEHCAKFQKFLDNEFESIEAIMNTKWDVFDVDDFNKIIRADEFGRV